MSRDPPPPLPGGYKVGDKVFFTGPNHTFPCGDKLVHGQQGEVMGPATFLTTLETVRGKAVVVRFPCNKGDVICYLDQVRRSTPPAPATSPSTPAPELGQAYHHPSWLLGNARR